MKMESSSESNATQSQLQPQRQGNGKYFSDSNVTVIQVFPSERANRRVDRNVSRGIDSFEPIAAEASDLNILTTPSISDGQVMKLHIINVRTGKIQDAVMLTTSNDHQNGYRSKFNSYHKGKSHDGSSQLQNSTKSLSIKNVKSEASTGNEIKNEEKNSIPKPYKQRKKFQSTKCKCEVNSFEIICNADFGSEVKFF